MKIKLIKYGKEFKVGLPQFSNLLVSMEMTVEFEEGEEPNHDECWDEVNRQLQIQTDGLDPSWILKKEDFKNFFKVTINIPKKKKK